MIMLLDLVEKFTETRCWEEVSREVENPENVGLRTGVYTSHYDFALKPRSE
jgi:hypothetical protein